LEYAADLARVFLGFRDPMPWGALGDIVANHPEFPPPTIYSWYRRWRRDPRWRPGVADRSHNHRKFTDAQEEEIELQIKEAFFSTHRRLSCRQFKGLTVAFWQRQRIEDTRTATFAASSHFRVNFQKRHRLSLRTPTLKKKEPERNEIVIARYLERVRAAQAKYGPCRVANMDETAWKDVQMIGKTIAPKGAKSVHVVVKGDPKAGMTVIATITAAATKLPLLYVLRAESSIVHSSLLPAVDENRVTHTTNGWMDGFVMLKYLRWLHYAMNEQPCALVMDSFPGHVIDAVMHKAELLGIEIIPVPEGLTGEFQPLDRSGFGPLKKISQALWDERAAHEPHLIWNHQEAAKILEMAWAQLPRRVLESAWDFKVLGAYGLTSVECEAAFTKAPFEVQNWHWEGEDEEEADEEEDEEEDESDDDDTAYGVADYVRDKNQQSDSDDEGPESSVVRACQHQRLEIARLRGLAKQNVDRRVAPVHVPHPFHMLDTYAPGWTGPQEKTQEEKNVQMAKRQLVSYSPAFAAGPYGRPYDKPDGPGDRSGFVFPQQKHRRWEDQND
jgi:hypothetical protein